MDALTRPQAKEIVVIVIIESLDSGYVVRSPDTGEDLVFTRFDDLVGWLGKEVCLDPSDELGAPEASE